jgi:hypothetical protein
MAEDPEHSEFEDVNTLSFLPISKSQLDQIKAETQRDDTLRALEGVILQGWPEDKNSASTSPALF